MFERLTGPAREAINEAQQLARASGASGMSGAHLLVGFVRCEPGIAGELLRTRVGTEPWEEALRVLAVPTAPAERPFRYEGFGEDLSSIVAAASGVTTAGGERRISTTSCLLGLLAIDSPSALKLLAAVGVDTCELADAARRAEDGIEGDPLQGEGAEGVWTVSVGDPGPGALAWSDGEE